MATSILVTGLLVHSLGEGAVGGFLGDALYAAFIYWLVVALVPRVRMGVVAGVAAGFCAAIEFLQLTPLSGALSRAIPGAYFIFGSTFQWRDLVAYAVGIAIVAAADARISAPAAGSSRGGSTTPSAGGRVSHPPAETPSR